MTAEEMKNLAPSGSLWDAQVKGLHLRASEAGYKAFYLYYRTKTGQQRRPKLGALGDVTLSDARKRARILLDRVAVGEDPKGEWEERKAELTVDELFEHTWQAHWAAERYQTSGWAYEVRRLYETRLQKDFGALGLSEMTPTRIREWHKKGDAPTSTNRALAVLSKLFHYAEEKEWRPQNSNPCHLVKNHPEKKRRRYATEDEIRRIVPLFDKYAKSSPHGVAFLILLMWTGARPRSIERARWDQLQEFVIDDKDYGILTFFGKSSSKTGQDEKVILPPQAMKAINRLPRIEGETITGIKTPVKLWRKIRVEAGCMDLWARDWRRTFATVGLSDGVDIGTIGGLLNHHSDSTTKVYAKVMDTRKLKAVTQIANRLQAVIQET